MGADAPMPPVAIPATTPAGRPRGDFKCRFPGSEIAPPYSARGPDQFYSKKCPFSVFHSSGVNARSCSFLQSKNFATVRRHLTLSGQPLLGTFVPAAKAPYHMIDYPKKKVCRVLRHTLTGNSLREDCSYLDIDESDLSKEAGISLLNPDIPDGEKSLKKCYHSKTSGNRQSMRRFLSTHTRNATPVNSATIRSPSYTRIR